MAHVVERFASWAVQFRGQPLAPEVLHHAKRAVIDLYAAMISGAAAALINGAAAHATEVDDIYRDGIYHPGAPTIPATLALAQTRGDSGEALLRAVVVGYEISTRIGDPDAPMSDAQLDAKYLELAAPVLGEAKARELLARLWRLEALPTLGE
jgi:2-methylcitrate dehydratase PrpD